MPQTPAPMKKTPDKAIIIAVGISVAALLIGLSCEKWDHTNPLDPLYTGPLVPSVNGTVMQLSKQKNITVIDTSNGTFIIQYTGQKPDVTAGSILVSAEGNGYLRKVISVQQSGSNTLVCQTEQACITDAVVTGEIDTTVALSFANANAVLQKTLPGVKTGENEISLDNVELYSGKINGVDVKVKLVEGSIAFKPNLMTTLKIRNQKLESFSIAAGGKIDLDFTMALEIPYAFDALEIPNNHVMLASYRWTQVYMIGYFPVVTVTELNFIAGYEAEAEVNGIIQAGFTGRDLGIEIGARFDQNVSPKWRPIFSPTGYFEQPIIDWTPEASAMLRGYVRPELNVYLYGLVGPSLGVEPYLKWEGNVSQSSSGINWDWLLEAGIDGTLGIDITILDEDDDVQPPEMSVTLYSKKIANDEGSFNGPLISVTPEMMDFEYVDLKKSKELSLRITNQGFSALEISSIVSSDPQFQVIGSTSLNVPKGNYQDVIIRFSPISSGLKNGTLSIYSNAVFSPKTIQMSGICQNTPPTASFTVNPQSGSTLTTFNFDASGSSDNEESLSDLRFRWDWENDGNWDTEYSSIKMASYVYPTPGTKTVKLEVLDSGGLTGTITKTIQVTESNGTLKGKVTCGINPLINVTIRVFDESNLLVTQTTGNYDGTYELKLPANVGYIVNFSKEGYYPKVYQGIYLAIGTTYTIDVDMERTFSLSIYPTNITLLNGETRQFTCTLTYSDNVQDNTPPITWSVTPGTAGQISQTGFFTAHASNTGVESVKAEYKDQTAKTSVTVQTKPVTVTSIEILPSTATIKNGENRQFNCWAHFSDGSKLDVTNSGQVGWVLNPGSAGSFNQTTGVFTAHATNTGTETITATYQSKTDQATVTVSMNEHEIGTVTDIDGNTYQTVKIGNQWWMAENLKVIHYRNGDAIPNVTDNNTWASLTTGAYCNYDNDANNAITYGSLYNWYAVNDSRNIVPEGWHVPSDAEWKTLEMTLGMSQTNADQTYWRGTDERGKLKETGTTHWQSPNTGATNESGFSALPGGYRDSAGYLRDLGYYATFWSSTEYDSYHAWYRYLYYINSGVGRLSYTKQFGFSVRCVRDIEPQPTLTNIEATPETATLESGDVQQFNCIAHYSDGSTKNATQAADWSITPGTSGGIDQNGLFTAHATNTGTGTITASYEGYIDQSTITVVRPIETGTVTDIDGNVYKTVKIGNQWWMAENLKVTHYRNGDAIPNVTDNSTWAALSTGAYCNYNNDVNNVAIYGRLYNWYTVNDARNIAPTGWHVPSDAEWKMLEMTLGMSQTNADAEGWRGTDEGGKLKETGTTHWQSPNTGATNTSAFSALPGGFRGIGGGFDALGSSAVFLSSTESSSGSAWLRNLYFLYSNIDHGRSGKHYGFSVRCVRDG